MFLTGVVAIVTLIPVTQVIYDTPLLAINIADRGETLEHNSFKSNAVALLLAFRRAIVWQARCSLARSAVASLVQRDVLYHSVP